MRYRELKDQRDAAVARAIEAERLSMKSEFDRVTAEFEAEKARLIAKHEKDVRDGYREGYNHGLLKATEEIVAHAAKLHRNHRIKAEEQTELFGLQEGAPILRSVR